MVEARWLEHLTGHQKVTCCMQTVHIRNLGSSSQFMYQMNEPFLKSGSFPAVE